jgi:hypothetical protein
VAQHKRAIVSDNGGFWGTDSRPLLTDLRRIHDSVCESLLRVVCHEHRRSKDETDPPDAAGWPAPPHGREPLELMSA